MHTTCPYGYINLCVTSSAKGSTSALLYCAVSVCACMSLRVTCRSTTTTVRRWCLCCRPPNVLQRLHNLNPRQRMELFPICRSRQDDPYLLHWVAQGFQEMHPAVAAAATTTTPVALVICNITFPRVHHKRGCEWSPFVAKNSRQRQFWRIPEHQSGRRLQQRVVLHQPTTVLLIQGEMCLNS